MYSMAAYQWTIVLPVFPVKSFVSNRYGLHCCSPGICNAST